MTRALIIGSSHVGALKSAEAAFAKAQPGIEVAFFGVRGPAFLKAQVDEAGLFHPGGDSDADRALVIKANGQSHVDTSAYDHVMLIGHRFGFNEVATLLEHHDIRGLDRAGHDQVLDLPLVKDMAEAMIDVTLPAVLDALAPAGRPFTFGLAPYPATSIAARAPKMEMARELVAFWAHPAAQGIFDLWHDRLRRRIEGAGHALLAQPATTVAGPFATRPDFAKAPDNFDGSAMQGADHRHMNADYGLEVLTAYARMLTPLSKAARLAPTLIKERI